MKMIKWLVLALGLFALPVLLHAQGSSRSAAPLDSVVQLTAEEQGLTLMDYSDLPRSGTFWLVCSNGLKIPMPCPPTDPTTPVYAISLADNIFLVDGTKGQVAVNHGQTAEATVTAQANGVVDLISQVQETAWERMMVAVLGGDESTNLQNFTSLTSVDYNTNGLFLEITNIANGLVNLNLHNATNPVYAIWSTTDLLTPWQVATELWPWDTNCQPFTLHMAGRQNLFLRAEDWTEADSDGDGLPDWWSWYWFGNLNARATNLDDLGNTFAYDFAMGLDPNVISFTLSTSSLYVNQTTVPVQINLSYGQPSYYAVLVNDTNQSHAVWHSFTGTNLLVTLGTTDGVYDVSVGLKGWSPEASETWDTDEITFTLDRTAPKLNLTSAVNATVIKPYLQVQGFADKPLAGLSYDINNGFGLATNQDAFVTGQHFDTNRADFTTNYFQAYDVALATNANSITLRVTDRAGNTTTTNFNVTLDYTTATNPPTANLTWPQDGWAVSGTNLTIRGTMSDETGSVVAQVVNGDGTTNLINGIVERNGNFWLENVPLDGTNQISIQAVDAAGNVTETNLTVKPSSLLLTIDSTPTGDALYQPSGTVSGRVSEPDAVVTVNGVTAEVDGDADADGNYSWTADGVPNYGEGTATYDATANTAGGSGGGSGNGNAGQTSTTVERGSYVAVTFHQCSEIITITNNGNGTWATETIGKGDGASAQTNGNGWLLNYGGTYGVINQGGGNGPNWRTSQNYQWAGQAPGTETQQLVSLYANINGTSGGYTNSYFTDSDNMIHSPVMEDIWLPGSPAYPMGYPTLFIKHYYAQPVKYQWQNDVGDATTVEMQVARTEVKLWTGGKSIAGKKSLFCIQPTAESFGQAPAAGWVGCPRYAIAAQKLQVMGKNPGADGKLWVALPEDSVQNITVTAPARHYNAEQGVTKYKLYIMANDTPLQPDHIVPEAKFSVGQKISFSPLWRPETPPFIDMASKFEWIFSGAIINNWNSLGYGYDDYFLDASLLKNQQTAIWYYIDTKKAMAMLNADMNFENGQQVKLSQTGLYKIVKPTVSWSGSTIYGSLNVRTNLGVGLLWLGLGTPQGENDGAADYDAEVDSEFPGDIGFTQLVNAKNEYGTPGSAISTEGRLFLDGAIFYTGTDKALKDSGYGFYHATTELSDCPGIIVGNDYTKFHSSFIDFVRFRPSGSASIWVTLGRADWGWDAETTNNSSGYPVLSVNQATQPVFTPSNEFPPLWYGVEDTVSKLQDFIWNLLFNL